jgi:hypothetical protein
VLVKPTFFAAQLEPDSRLLDQPDGDHLLSDASRWRPVRQASHERDGGGEQVKGQPLVDCRAECGRNQRARVVDRIAVDKRGSKLVNEDPARDEERLTGIEIIDHPRKEPEDLLLDTATTGEELAAGGEQNRRKPLVKPAQHQTQSLELTKIHPDGRLSHVELLGELGDIEHRVRGMRHARRLQEPQATVPVILVPHLLSPPRSGPRSLSQPSGC